MEKVIDYDWYSKTYGGIVSEAEFETAVGLACAVIDAALANGVSLSRITEEDTSDWVVVQTAVAMQVDMIARIGVEAYTMDFEYGGQIASESVAVGGVSRSVSYGAGGAQRRYAGYRISPQAWSYLANSGLLARVRWVR